MQRSSSFCNNEKQSSSSRQHATPPPSRIPTASSRNNGASVMSAGPMLRRSASLRLPSLSRTPSTPLDREVWGVGSGSWGKRQQTRRQQGLDRSRNSVTPPVVSRGLGSTNSIDTINIRGSINLDDDDDLCSERSYDSTMSMDRVTSRSRRYVVHCGSSNSDMVATANGATYLTPTQRAAQLNKELKSRLRQALEDIASREREISRLTQECVELRMSHVRRMGSASPDRIRSTTPPGIERDSLNSSVHSNYELLVPTESISLSNKKEIQDEEAQKLPTSVRLEFLPVLQENSLMSNDATKNLDNIPNQEEKENLSNNRQLNKNVFSKDMNQRSISVKSVIDDKDCSQLAPPSFLLQPLSLADSGTCDEDLSLISPPSDLALTSPELDSQDLEDGELYREVLEALQSSQHSALSATVSNTEHEKVDCAIQTDTPAPDVSSLKEQLTAAQEALIETKGAQQRWPETETLLSAEEAVLLWRRASLQVQLSRVRAAAKSSPADVTLQFLKSAFFHLVTDSGQGASSATKSHWKAIQSILGFSPEECQAMDNAVTAGTFPGGAW